MSATTNRYSSHQPPPLPIQGANPCLINYKGKLRGVRTQAITLGPTSTITIARIKTPAPEKKSYHLIKRFDTNAVSATSFFKCAFPFASEEDEETQMKYLHQIYDTHSAGALGLGPDHKLTGVWVPVEYANELAEAYGLTLFATPLIAFPPPDPTPAVETSPTQTKKEEEQQQQQQQQNEPASQPTPKGRATYQSKPSVDQTPTSARTTKRSKVGPPSFGNTSPSNFNLSSLNNQSDATKKINTPNLPGSGGHMPDSVPTSAASTNQSTNSIDDRSHRKNTSSEANGDLHTDRNAEKSSMQPSKKLIGTEEEVSQAKEEARKLVSSLKSSSSTFSEPTEKNINNTLDSNKNQPPSRVSEPVTINRKRSLEEVVEEEEEEGDDQTSEPSSASSLIKSSFLKKTFWRKSAEPPRKKRPFPSSSSSNSKKEERSSSGSTLEDESSLDSSKRNLAIAGIFIAGAAASIVPYFF